MCHLRLDKGEYVHKVHMCMERDTAIAEKHMLSLVRS